MFVSWKVKDSKPFTHIKFVEHTKELTWNENDLKKLHSMNCNYFAIYDSTTLDTWLVDNNMTLKPTIRARILEGNLELNISISKREEIAYPARPLRVDLKR
jgi:hypothetical protein